MEEWFCPWFQKKCYPYFCIHYVNTSGKCFEDRTFNPSRRKES